MTVKEILTQLKSLGDEKMRAHHIKHGAGDNLFGVKMGELRILAKTIKINHELGLELWKAGNIDAMLLAILIMKPKLLSVDDIHTMVKEANFDQLADWFNAYIIKEYPNKENFREKWMASKDPWTARAGWSLMSGRIARAPEGLDIPAILKRIETEMPKAAPEVQWTMNSALAQIGIHFPALRAKAIAIGEKLGIYRDYPVSKGCTSPFAPIWINEMVKRQGAPK